MRTNLISLIVGGRGVGKTTYLKDIISKYPKSKKILIIDTLDHPAYQEFEIIKQDSSVLKRWRKGTKRIIFNNFSECLNLLNQDLRNALLICEDATKYTGSTLQEDFRKLIYDSKQKNIDIVFMFHLVSSVPPELIKNCNTITFFKVYEDISIYKSKLPNFAAIMKLHAEVMKHESKHYKKTILVD